MELEYVLLAGVPLLCDIEVTREAVIALCSSFGAVGDVVVARTGGLASVGFFDPTHAQDAILQLNGSLFRGNVLHAHVAPPPRTWLNGYIVTMRASRTILVENESYLRVAVKLRRWAGVTSLTSVRHDACLIVANSSTDGALIKRMLAAHRNRHGTPVYTTFLRKG